MELALNVESIDDVAARLTDWLDFKSPQGLREGKDSLGWRSSAKFFPRRSSQGAARR
jgi:hypothetical protein